MIFDAAAVRKTLGVYMGVAIERSHENAGWWIYGPGGRSFMGDCDLERMMGDEHALIERIQQLKPGLPAKYRFRIGRRLRK